MGEVQHIVYGRDADTPTDTAIQGTALGTIRTVRAARISSVGASHCAGTADGRGARGADPLTDAVSAT